MPRKVFFHVGAHKAASTTIQNNLKLNRRLLSDSIDLAAVLVSDYPDSYFFRFFLDLSDGTVDCNDEASFDQAVSKARASFEEILAGLDPSKSVFFSYEGFLGYCRLHEYKALYPHSRFVFTALRKIASDYDVKIVLIIRRQDSYIESCYLQQLKVGRCLDFNSYFSSLALDSFSWFRVAEEAARLFGADNLQVLHFEGIREVGALRFLSDILRFLSGHDVSGLEMNVVAKSNESLSQKGVELCLAAYPLLEKIEDRRAFREFVAKHYSVERFGRARLLSQRQTDMVMSACRHSNQRLEQYLPGIPCMYG